MGVRNSSINDILDEYIIQAMEILNYEIVRGLSYLGESAVNAARLPHEKNWIDQTGNLRSSIGYAVYEEGKKQIQSAFEVVREGEKGHSEGIRMVEELARRYSDTYALVVVAGMDYASLVEARDNRDVLASATAQAMQKMEYVLTESVNKAVQRINELQ